MPYDSDKTIEELIVGTGASLDLLNDLIAYWDESAPVGDETKRVAIGELLARTTPAAIGAATAGQGALANTALQPGFDLASQSSGNLPSDRVAGLGSAALQPATAFQLSNPRLTDVAGLTPTNGHAIFGNGTNFLARSISILDVANLGNSLANKVDNTDSRLTDQRVPIDGSVTDQKIGNRTVDQTLATPDNTGTLTQILSWLAGRIRAITGVTNWFDAPATTLAATATHIANTTNPHNTTAAQVGAYTTAQVDSALAGKANTTHNQAWSTITATPTTIAGYGITDAVNTSAVGSTIARLSGGQHLASESRASTINYNSVNGVISFTDARGTLTTIDLPIENLFQNASYNSGTQTLTLTTNGGGTVDISLATLVDLPEIVVATSNPGVTPSTGQRLYLRSDTGEYWISTGAAWAGPFLSFTAAERTKLSALPTAAALQISLDDRVLSTDTRLFNERVPIDGSVTNTKVATNAGIEWSKINKSGAIAGDVGAAASNDPRFSRIFWDAIGSTVPSSPTTGFRWYELSPAGIPLMGWFFDGAGTWFSTELYAATLVAPSAGFFLTNPNLPSFTAQAFCHFDFPYSVGAGYAITSMRADVRSSVAHSATNFINMRVRGWSLDMSNTVNTQTLTSASAFSLYTFTPTGNTIIPFTSIETVRLQLELQTQGTVTGNFIGMLRAEARLYR